MASHSRELLEEMLARAEFFVAEGQERIVAQQARVAGLVHAGREVNQSKSFLRTLEDTQALQINHVAMLRRALEVKRAVSWAPAAAELRDR